MNMFFFKPTFFYVFSATLLGAYTCSFHPPVFAMFFLGTWTNSQPSWECEKKIDSLGDRFKDFWIFLPRTTGTWSSLSTFFFSDGCVWLNHQSDANRFPIVHLGMMWSSRLSGHNSKSLSLFSWRCVCPMLLLEDWLHQHLRVDMWSMFFLFDYLSTMCPFQ